TGSGRQATSSWLWSTATPFGSDTHRRPAGPDPAEPLRAGADAQGPADRADAGRAASGAGRGAQASPHRLRRRIRRLRRRQHQEGVSATAARVGFTPGEVTPYTLRHTAATWMAQVGVPLWEIAGHLGHQDTRMVEKHYAHHDPEFRKRAKR